MLEYNYTDELYHHGVKGQKWGVRRYQNKDGTLTDLGKKRLYDDEDSKALLDESRKKMSSNFGLENVSEIKDAAQFLRKQADVVEDNFNNYAKIARQDYNNLHKNDKFIADVKQRLGKDMEDLAKKDSEYREIYEMEIEDHVYDCYRKYLSPETTKAHDAFFNSYYTYAENSYKIADDIVGGYGHERLGKRSLFKNTDTSFIRAVSNTIRDISNENGAHYLHRLAEDMQEDDYFHMVEGVTHRIMKELDD